MHCFHHFLFLPFNQPTGSLQRGVMTCSHLHPLRPQPSSMPHGFHYFYTHTHTHTSDCPWFYMHSLTPLRCMHVPSSLPETRNYFLQTLVLTCASIFNYSRAKQAGTERLSRAALMSLPACSFFFFFLVWSQNWFRCDVTLAVGGML